RVSRAGDALGHFAVPLKIYYSNASIAFGASTYVVAWSDDTGLYARRFTSAGDPIDAAPILIRKVPYLYSAVASSGSSFLIVWPENGITGAQMAADGVVSDAKTIALGLPPQLASYDDGDFDLAWNGKSFLLVWGLYIPSQVEGLP